MTTASRRIRGWFAGLLVALPMTACTNSGGDGSTSAVPTPGSTAPGPTGSPVRPSTPGSGAPSAPVTSGSPADPTTKAQITAAYRAFFDGRSTTAQSEAALQNGKAFHTALVEQSKNAYASGAGVKVGPVSVNGDLGFVTYTITQNGSPLLSDAKGYAVRQAGRWKVAAITFCTLMHLQGGAPAACNNPTLTALPQ